VLLLLLISGCATAPKASKRFLKPTHTYGPWSVSPQAPTVASKTTSGRTYRGGSGFVDFAFTVYAKTITRVDGPRCEHHPTCSRYAVDAIHKHGYVVGSMLTIDRIIRGSHSSVLRDLPIWTVEDGRTYFDDPVENNDFFF